ncbi:ferritin-like domain-containing protein [Mucilaginibacter sp. 22184]|uniref:ferritin-like domain-containing protein n=1 Tax=Mucilaginibacter sp. 22184 TaxID=3453887 RepID=UPI003F83451C
METTEKTTDILNDLIEINNDRAAGFEKAAADLNDENIDLKATFDQLAQQSRTNVTELAAAVGRNNGAPETGTSVSGSLHRAWIDVKALFGGSDRKSILEECERGEDAIKKAYRDALTETELEPEARQLIQTQGQSINASHDTIKGLRDM